jgi:hypothetical protein
MENIEEVREDDIMPENQQGEEFTNLPIAPPGQDNGARMENIEEILDRDNMSESSQGVETVENIKLKDRSGNVIENKGSASEATGRSGNVTENKGSYPLKAEMLLKRKEVGCRR